MAVGYNNNNSIGNVVGNYGGTTGNLSISRKITRSVHTVASFSARQYNSPDFDKYNRVIYEAKFGVGFAPGDVPIRIW
jgi:hypothetical protein